MYRFSGVNDIFGDSDDIENTECFDESGKTLCVYSSLTGKTEVIGAQTVSYGSESTEAKNKIKESAVSGIHTVNLLKNHSFEHGSRTGWTKYGKAVIGNTGAYSGNLAASVDLSSLTAVSGVSQQVSLTRGTYTFSAYCHSTVAGSGNVSVYLKAAGSSGELGRSTAVTKETSGWERLSVTFDVVKASDTVTVSLEAAPGKKKESGKVKFDCAQLETGSLANEYNFLENGSFEWGISSSADWTSSRVISDQISKTGLYTDGKQGLHIKGSAAEPKTISQRVKLELTTLPNRTDGASDPTSIVNVYDQYGNLTQTRRGRTASNTTSTSFTYDEIGELTGIRHNGFDYGLSYDAFGNATDITVAGTVLLSTEYAVNNGRALTTTGADGTTTEQEYNSYGDVTASLVNGSSIKEYTYLNSGHVGEAEDQLTGETSRYTYDLTGRLTGSEVLTGEGSAETEESKLSYKYGTGSRVTGLSYQEQGGTVRSYQYTYDNDGNVTKTTLPDGSTVSGTYDSYGRAESRKLETGTAKTKVALTAGLGYLTGSRKENGKNVTTKTGLVSTVTNSLSAGSKTTGTVYTYTYDYWGNLATVKTAAAKTSAGKAMTKVGSETITSRSYTYDKQSQVSSATEGSTAYTYNYDAGGNITSETVKTGKTTQKHTYKYSTSWKDQLLSYDGKAIRYDVMGRPVSYMGDAMTWTAAGLLESISASGKSTFALKAKSSAKFSYNADGLRVGKSVRTDSKNESATTYRYNNGMLLSETRQASSAKGTETLRYYYDASGRVTSLGYVHSKGVETGYFPVYNGQGDVVAIYRSADGVLMGTYEYDLWGKPVKTAKTSADNNNITAKNPIRYCSYDRPSGVQRAPAHL